MTMGLKANADGSGAIQVGGSDAITISAALNTAFAGTAAVPTGTLYPIVSGTAVASTSGTSIDFTSIPSWVKRITVMFNNVSLSASSSFLIQLGSTTFTVSGYSAVSIFNTGSISGALTSSSGIPISSGTASNQIFGQIVLVNVSGNIWVSSGVIGQTQTTAFSVSSSGYVALSGTLDRVRITTVNGTDTFDAGSINILYE